jgi:hypothetical protein
MSKKPMQKAIGVRLPDSLFKTIEEIARRDDTVISEVVRSLLEEGCSKSQENPFLNRGLMAYAANIATVLDRIDIEYDKTKSLANTSSRLDREAVSHEDALMLASYLVWLEDLAAKGEGVLLEALGLPPGALSQRAEEDRE